MPLTVYSTDYDVSGYGSDGYYYGEIETNSSDLEVDGHLYDEDGNSVYFNGEWTGLGQEVEGYGENGDYIQLEVE